MRKCRKLGLIFLILPLILTGCKEKEETILHAGQEAEAPEIEEQAEITQEEKQEEAPEVTVYVCGAVHQPGVYELPADGRICDAIEKAGGVTADARETLLNLAEHVSDGQKIQVPTEGEALLQEEEARENASGLVNLNTADATELMNLPGIGESKAADILAYREEKGAFQNIEDIMNISGIKEGLFHKIKDKITV